MVETQGVEPWSEDVSERTSTRVGSPFEVSLLPTTAGLQEQQVNYVSVSLR